MDNTFYQAVFVEPWPWWAGGIAIGLLVPLLYLFLNVALGVSTGYGSIIRLFKRPHLSWFAKNTFDERWGWRIFFLGGMLIGAFLARQLEGRPMLSENMGVFTEAFSGPFLLQALFFLLGGTLLGLGARIAGACTSWHSIHGLATGQASSLVATLAFLVGGAVAANLIRITLLGGMVP